jgi:hypothetical protein
MKLVEELKMGGVCGNDEERRLDFLFLIHSNLGEILTQDRPHVAITIGSLFPFPNLIKSPFDIRKRWP